MGIQLKSHTIRRRMRRILIIGAALGAAGVVAATAAVADSSNVSWSSVDSHTNNFHKVETHGFVDVALLPGAPTIGVWTTARATAINCTGCRAVAIDAHVVIVGGTPQYLSAHNQAVAQNRFCSGCASVALAYQIVATARGPVALTSAGQAQLANLSAALQSLASHGAPATMARNADSLVARVVSTLHNNVVPLTTRSAGGAAPQSLPTIPKVTVQVFRQYHIA